MTDSPDRLADQVRQIDEVVRGSGLDLDAIADRILIKPETMRKYAKGYQPASDRIMRLIHLIIPVESSSTPRSRLKAAREKSGLSQKELARKIGYDLGVLQAIEDGNARITERMAEKICEVIAIDKEDLLGGSESPRVMDETGRRGTFGATPDIEMPPGKRARYVPLLSWAQAGALDAGFTDEAYDYSGTVSVDLKDRKAFGITIRGDSMVPEIQEGDDVIVSPSASPSNGEIVIARTIHGDVMCKLYQTREGGTKVVLSSYNPAYPPIELSRDEIAWIYPVRGAHRKYPR